MMARKKAKVTVARPYTCDYGTTKGHCAAPKRAVLSAMRYLDAHGKRHCVIEAPGGVVVDIWWNAHFGPIVKVRGNNVIKLKEVK
jgi:hypothetical protein